MSLDIEGVMKFQKNMESKLRQIPICKMAYEKTKVPVTYLILVVFVIFVIGFYIFSGMKAITTMVGVIYPTYCTLKAIKSEDKEDDTLWLCYWVIYGILSLIESITDVLFFWVPFYQFIKIILYLFLFSPTFQGAKTLYDKFLSPVVDKLEDFEKKLLSTFHSDRNGAKKK